MMDETKQNGPRHLTHHLSEDELDDLLIGAGSLAQAEHVSGCVLCRERMAAFESAMGNFNQATLAWAEAKSDTISRDILPAAGGQGSSRFARLWTTGAVAVAIALSAAVGLHRSASDDSVKVIKVGAPAADGLPAAEIVQDNALLADIDSALDAPVASPMEAFESRSARQKTDSVSQVNN